MDAGQDEKSIVVRGFAYSSSSCYVSFLSGFFDRRCLYVEGVRASLRVLEQNCFNAA